MLLAGDTLHPLDNEFFDEYKRLDCLCSDMYSSRGGVGLYIEDMERNAFDGRHLVTSWEDTYIKLKHLRWVRNRIAHDPGQLNICTEQDIKDIGSFYDSILSRQDPLALLHQAQTAPRQKTLPTNSAEPDTAKKTYDIPYYPPKSKQNTNAGGCSRFLWIFIVIIIALMHFIFNYFK